MDNIRLRKAKASDQQIITKLVLQNQLNIFGLGWDNFTVAMSDDDAVVGFGQVKRHGDVDELASLVVVDEWRGQGVSSILLNELLNRSRRPLWLMCESTLVTYYTRYGFNEVAEPAKLPAYFRNLYWLTRFAFGLVFLVRGTHVAFMRLDKENSL